MRHTHSRVVPLMPTILLSAVALVLGIRQPAAAQTVERTIFASVTTDDGKPVASVAPEDLVVREDRVVREILRVTPATEPLQIAVLVDNTAAASEHIANIREALTAFSAQMTGAGSHELSLIAYADRPTVLAEATTSLAALERGIGRVFSQTTGGSYLVDTITETARGFAQREAKRPVIVAISTEGIEFSNTSYERALEALRESGATLYTVLVQRTPVPQTDEVRARNIVTDRGVRESGGRREYVLTSLALRETLTRIGEELLHQQQVVFARPGTLIPPKQTTIEAARPGLKARGALAPLPRTK